MAHINAALVQNIFNLAQAERITDVIHDGEFDDFWAGFVIFEGIFFAHMEQNIRYRPKLHFNLTRPSEWPYIYKLMEVQRRRGVRLVSFHQCPIYALRILQCAAYRLLRDQHCK
jgi:hypothetical protein